VEKGQTIPGKDPSLAVPPLSCHILNEMDL